MNKMIENVNTVEQARLEWEEHKATELKMIVEVLMGIRNVLKEIQRTIPDADNSFHEEAQGICENLAEISNALKAVDNTIPFVDLPGRRERIATAVLAGFAADPAAEESDGSSLARWAVGWADALIEKLDKKE